MIRPGDPPLFPELRAMRQRPLPERGLDGSPRIAGGDSGYGTELLQDAALVKMVDVLQAGRASFGASKMSQCRHQERRRREVAPRYFGGRWDGSKSKPEGLGESR
jgi:hypothetical protein